MIDYIQWFLDGLQNVQVIAPQDEALIWVVLCCAIPIVLTICGCVALIWCVVGIFGGVRK